MAVGLLGHADLRRPRHGSPEEAACLAGTPDGATCGDSHGLHRGRRICPAPVDRVRAQSAFEVRRKARELEGGLTPILRPSVLGQMGYGIALYGITLLLRITRTMQRALDDLRSDELKLVGTGVPFEEYTRIVGIERWRRIEREFGQT